LTRLLAVWAPSIGDPLLGLVAFVVATGDLSPEYRIEAVIVSGAVVSLMTWLGVYGASDDEPGWIVLRGHARDAWG
jgi:hypothetical protein